MKEVERQSRGRAGCKAGEAQESTLGAEELLCGDVKHQPVTGEQSGQTVPEEERMLKDLIRA